MKARLSSMHIGKKKQPWIFECDVCDVRGLPDSGVSRVVVVWDRGRKAVMTPAVDVTGGYARWDSCLSAPVSLFSAKSGAIDAKMCRLQIYDADRMNVGQMSSRSGLIAGAQLDLAQYATLADRDKIIQLPLESETCAADIISMRPGVAPRATLLQIRLRAHERTEADAASDDDDNASVKSGSSARSTFSALTHRMVPGRPRSRPGSVAGAPHNGARPQPHDERDEFAGEGDGGSTIYDDDRPARQGIQIEGSSAGVGGLGTFRRGNATKELAEAQARIASLESQLASKRADAQSFESTVGILRHRLDVEVLEDLGATLERARGLKPQEAAQMFKKQLIETSERLEALIIGDQAEPGGNALERELVMLRHQLAANKLLLAEVTLENGELKQELKELRNREPEPPPPPRGIFGGLFG